MDAERLLTLILNGVAAVLMLGLSVIGYLLHDTLQRLRKQLDAMGQTVERHSESLATGNERFRGIDKDLEDLRRMDDRRCRQCLVELPALTPMPFRRG